MKEKEIKNQLEKLNELAISEIKKVLESDLEPTARIAAIKRHCGQYESLYCSILEKEIQFTPPC